MRFIHEKEYSVGDEYSFIKQINGFYKSREFLCSSTDNCLYKLNPGKLSQGVLLNEKFEVSIN